ncbi:MAG: hypothetical protein EON58_04975 [Alphaproteobacteria bacterium]|nr:MAG: hypothetical protein EON58_04975 [Alphaproteobacteria bacterium]
MSSSKRVISAEEEAYLIYGLYSKVPKTVKRSLQRLCSYYESGRFLKDNNSIRLLLFGHLGSDDIEARRYSLKALGLIGSTADVQRVIDRLNVEPDIETQSWGMSALAAMRRGKRGKDLTDGTNLDLSKAMRLSTLLYGRQSDGETSQLTVAIEKDGELALKWSLFLVGYDRAPRGLFGSTHPDDALVGELTAHSSEIVREYAVWTLWERDGFGFARSRVKLEDAHKQPPSVKKWLYQLALKTPDDAELTPDLLEDLSRDADASAREGLARGAASLATRFEPGLCDWLRREDDELVRLELLEGLARNPHRSEAATGLLLDVYSSGDASSPERKRLLVAATGTQLYGQFRQIGQAELAGRSAAKLDFAAPVILQVENLIMNDSSIHAGGDVNAQILNSGTMIESANNAVQRIEGSHLADKEILESILKWLQDSKIAEAEKAEVAAAVEATAKEPSEANKKNLFVRLQDIATGIGKFGGAIGGLAAIIKAAQAWGGVG